MTRVTFNFRLPINTKTSTSASYDTEVQKIVKTTSKLTSHRFSPAFTVVELLVTVVVIAILAVVSYVSYMGITSQATKSVLMETLSNDYKALLGFQSTYDAFPTSISYCNQPDSNTNSTQMCLSTNGSITLKYTFDNSNPQTFTLYAQKDNQTYKISTYNSQPTQVASNKTCPNNYALVPGSSTYGTSDFCVMKYEAKVYGNDNGNLTFSSSNLPNSRPGGNPYVNIIQANAINQSPSTVDGQGNTISANAHLITEAEWMTIAQNVLSQPSNWSGGSVGNGFIYNGHIFNNPNVMLAADSNDSNSNYGEDVYNNSDVNSNNKRTLLLSSGDTVWDMAGNALEWTSGQTSSQPGISGAGLAFRDYTDITSASGSVGSMPVNVFPSGTGIAGSSSWNKDNGIGRIYSNADDTTTRGCLRGGYRNNGSDGGILYLYLGGVWSLRAPGSNVGFRVVIPAE